MGFLIYGRDAAVFDESEHPLHEVHQTYMDTWSARLVARGPTLSGDGSRHTGSIHVLDTTDPRVAEKFAFDEPYAQAGWYSTIVVPPFESLLAGTMWDRPKRPADTVSSFVLVSWTPTRRTPAFVDEVAGDGPQWPFAGLLRADDAEYTVGFAGGVDLSPAAASQWLQDRLNAVEPTDVEVHRWQRGGRSQD